MKIPIPFTKLSINIEKRGIRFTSSTGLPITFDMWRSQFNLTKTTPMLELIYQTIASEFSKIDLLLVRDWDENSADNRVVHMYQQQKNNPNYSILALRPNMLQTKSELLYTIAYQLHKHGNALVRIVRDPNVDRNIVKSLEPVNVDDYFFGQGYEINGNLYLKLKEKKTGKIVLLDYNDTIHVRLNPNDFFHGDETTQVDLTNFITLFDENLNTMLNELKNAGTVNGIIELGAGITGGSFNSVLGAKEDKTTKQQEIIDRIKATKGGILVLDSGEKWTSLTRQFKTMGVDEINNMIKYLYTFKGISQAVIDGTATESQMEVFFNKTIMPPVERLIEELNYKFLTQTARTQGMKIEHFKNPFEYMSTNEVLKNMYLGAMFVTQNEGRRFGLKLPPLDGGDVLMDNKNFTKMKNDTTGGDAGGEKDSTVL